MHASIFRSSFRYLHRPLIFALLFGICLNSFATSRPPVPLDPVVAKQVIQNRGIGLGIRVTEVDGTNIRGIITAIHEDTFEVTPKGTIQSTQVSFSGLTKIHNDGSSRTGRIVKGALIGFGVLSAVSVILAVIGGGL
jgi:hypothetical protein